jgi:MYXO-CTERM domain-containing protein
LGGADDLDIFITRSTDKGVNYEPYQLLAGDQSPSFNELEEMESQLRPTPDGKTVYSVWNRVSEEDGANGRFAISVETDIPPGPDGGVGGAGGDGGAGGAGGEGGTGGTEPPPSMTTSGCGSCTVSSQDGGSGILLALAVLGALLWRRRRPLQS